MLRAGLLSLLVFFAQMTVANGWVSSGGGDLYGAEKNPWFLRNVKTVHYCLAIDSRSISASKSELLSAIKGAIDFWKDEFGADQSHNDTGLATQDFVETTCNGKEDIKFIFGAGELDPAQNSYLKGAREQLGIAVRTHYDAIELRGKGFVYVASDKGPGLLKNAPLLDGLWSSKNMLLGILIHEMGHVFGLPHVGDGLMSESFAEKIASSPFSFMLRTAKQMPPVLKAPAQTSSCDNIDREVFMSLGIADSSMPATGAVKGACLHLKSLKNNGEDRQWALSYTSADGQETAVGTVVTMSVAPGASLPLPINLAMSFVSSIYLTDQQKVFSGKEIPQVPDPRDPSGKSQMTLNFLPISASINYGWPGTLQMNNGSAPKSVYVNIKPDGPTLTADVNGQVRLIYSPGQLVFF